MIARHVRPNRNLTPQALLDATSRKQYTAQSVVDAMPHGEGEEVKVIFFKLEAWEYTRPGYISDDDLEKALERRSLKSADPYSLSKVNEDDPAFADSKPNATHWKDTEGKWCYAAFNRWVGDERDVSVYRSDDDWSDSWWFAGLRK